jgi:hypothetical protein
MSRKTVDWDALEPHYRAGIRSLKDIGAEFDCSDAAIIKHAKAHKWTRNLRDKIKQRAAEKVSAAMVSAEVSAQTKVTEEVRIEVESEVQARIELSHRKDITKARALAVSLLEELEDQTANRDLYERLGELLRKEDDKGVDKLNDLYHKVISFGGRTTGMKQLADTLKVLVDLERRAYGIDTRKNMEDGLEALLGQLDE